LPPAPAAGAAAAAPVEEQTEFTVDPRRLPATRRSTSSRKFAPITGLGLKEAKDLVEGAPKPSRKASPRTKPRRSRSRFRRAGAKVERQVIAGGAVAREL
jgi:large subunit ribosomal protein L7/L12